MANEIDKITNPVLLRRYKNTLDFLSRMNVKSGTRILDLGSDNMLSQIMRDTDLQVFNTGMTDLDLKPEIVKDFDVELVTAFEILEHLVSPFPLLQQLPGKKLIVTIPLRLWFSPAYRNLNDPWDNHYHEFEDWQFDWLLEKSGWKIIHSEKWKSPGSKIGFRPFLRKITPRYYAVYAERS